MIKKTLATVMLSVTLSFSSLSFAAKLEQNMDTLAKNFKVFNKAENQTDALQALDNMKAAALDAKQVKLKNHDANAMTSDALYDQLLAEIDKTRLLVQDGKLDQAKVEGKKIAAVKDQGHAVYNHH
ncbi:cytochrome b562 [Acinetobacter terrae]|uniref:ATP-binding protein n=1 Tax=Acinetobacter terrae TaxID=2731247 RepID=A0A4R0EMN9_9GAMM|nr:cytochrome b562 [Acinetobacter terrae]NNH15874.1 ATP-binding protein [Acinetobacter terrae]OAL87639.1 ATP-binding protein [Acinetobacter terrae]TCB59367.1 ATP-binding protein [Acinetobacter terrae]